ALALLIKILRTRPVSGPIGNSNSSRRAIHCEASRDCICVDSASIRPWYSANTLLTASSIGCLHRFDRTSGSNHQCRANLKTIQASHDWALATGLVALVVYSH